MSDQSPDSPTPRPQDLRDAFTHYKVPVIAGGIAVAMATVIVLPLLLAPDDPYSGVAECDELFTDELLTELRLEDVRMEELDPDTRFDPLPPAGEEHLLCGDTESASLATEFTRFAPAADPTHYGELQDMVADRRETEQAHLDGSEQRDAPFSTTELEDIEAGDTGFAVLYEPSEDERWDYADWSPTEHGRSHASAVFSTRNVLVKVNAYGASPLPDAPLGLVKRVAEALEERIAETGDTDRQQPPPDVQTPQP